MAERVQLISSMPGLDDARSIAEFMFKQQMFQAEQAQRAEQMRLQREEMEYNKKMRELQLKQQQEAQKMEMDLMKRKIDAQIQMQREKSGEDMRDREALTRFGNQYSSIQRRAGEENAMMQQATPQISQTAEQLLAMTGMLGGGLGLAGGQIGDVVGQALSQAQPGAQISEQIQQNFPKRDVQSETMAALLQSGMRPQTIDDVSRAMGLNEGIGGRAQKMKGTQLLGKDPLTGQMAYIDPVTGEWKSRDIPRPAASEFEPEVSAELSRRGLASTLGNAEKIRKELSTKQAKEATLDAKKQDTLNKFIVDRVDKISGDQITKDFDTVSSGLQELSGVREEIQKEYDAAKRENRPVRAAPLQRLAGYRVSKFSDPTTGVRDTELRESLATSAGPWTRIQTWLDNVSDDTNEYTSVEKTLQTLDTVMAGFRNGLQKKMTSLDAMAEQAKELIDVMDPTGEYSTKFEEVMNKRGRRQMLNAPQPAASTGGTKTVTVNGKTIYIKGR